MTRLDRTAAALAAALVTACSHGTREVPDGMSYDDGGPGGDADGADPGDGGGGGGGGGGLVCGAATCLDPATGLTWEDPPGAALLGWAAAVARCADLELEGGGWRLPRIQELRSLIRGCPNTAVGGACQASDPDCAVRACMAGCDQCETTIVNGEIACLWPAELHGACDVDHWSGTVYADSIDPGAWYVGFGHGAFVHGMLQTQPLRSRCVRGPTR